MPQRLYDCKFLREVNISEFCGFDIVPDTFSKFPCLKLVFSESLAYTKGVHSAIKLNSPTSPISIELTPSTFYTPPFPSQQGMGWMTELTIRLNPETCSKDVFTHLIAVKKLEVPRCDENIIYPNLMTAFKKMTGLECFDVCSIFNQ